MITPLTEDAPLLPVHPEGQAEVFFAAAAGLAEAGRTRSDLDLRGDERTRVHRPSTEAVVSQLRARLHASSTGVVHLGPYTVTRYLDGGAAGDVFEARLRGQRLAMKVLREVTASGLARFKREFRGAQRVSHRNLVTVHELVAEDDEWFFTMEHVEGPGFLAHVRGAGPARGAPPREPGQTAEIELSREPGASLPESEGALQAAARVGEPGAKGLAPTLDEARLRAALRELALGICALHQTGQLHLDLNPSNVKVCGDGRVVILDFGLIRNESSDGELGRCRGGCGTPPYMAPEQIDREPGTASDWYAFGVMLFEALTGHPPFSKGGTKAILDAKQRRDAPRAASLVPGLPEDLATLADDLLARDPARRPTGAEVLARLDARFPGGAPMEGPPSAPRFVVGRVRELALLDAAFEAAAGGGERIAHVRGPSGSGKSALLRRFLDELEQGARAQVLRARCHERERLPRKGLNALADALASLLATLPAQRLAELVPTHAAELTRLFPILGALAAPAPRYLPGQERDRRDQRALAALKQLVLRLAAGEPLVLHLDDADGCDLPSLRWLMALAAPGEAPAPFLILSYRDEALDTSPVRRALDDLRAEGHGPAILLGVLDRSEAVALALSRLPHDAQAQSLAEAIARASGGEVLLVEELARWASGSARSRKALRPEQIALERFFEARIARLSPEALALLSIVAIAERPLAEDLALALAGTGPSADLAALRELGEARLLRRLRHADHPTLETGHPLLRRVLLASLPAERRRQLHLALAFHLADARPCDAEALAEHFLAGGDLDAARRHTALAAEEAARALDFDRAAGLCQQALAFHPLGKHLDRPLQVRCAEALVGAGRRDEAVTIYLAVAEGAPEPMARDLRRRSVEQLFAGGEAARGLALLRPLLEAHGLRYPESHAAARLSLTLHLAWLRVRGTAVSPRGERRIPAELRAKISAAWSAGRSLAGTDTLRASVLLLEALRLALEAGDAGHVAPGLAFVAAFFPRECGPTPPTEALLARSARLGAELDAPYSILFTRTCQALVDLGAGRFRRACEQLADTRARWRGFGAACPWERALGRSTLLSARFALGELAEHGAEAQSWRDEARAAQDPHAEIEASVHLARSLLAAGDAQAARRLAEAAQVGAPTALASAFPGALALGAACDLHEGRPHQALAALDGASAPLQASSQLGLQAVRIELACLRGAAALAIADQGGAATPGRLRPAEAAALALAAEDRPHAAGSAALLRAGIARLQNQLGLSLAELRAAEACFDLVGMRLHVAVCQRRRGLLLGGRAGRALVEGADEALRACGIGSPERWMRTLGGLGR